MKTRVMSLMVVFMLGIITAFAADKTETFKVEGVNDSCQVRIEKAAKYVDGVTAAEWNQETGMLTVTYNDETTDLNKIEMAIAKAGHDTPMHKATDEDYNNLPNNCKYRSTDKKKESMKNNDDDKGIE